MSTLGIYQESDLLTNSNGSILKEITDSIESCKSFWFSVAFMSYGGIQLLVDSLDKACNKNTQGRILTSTYLSFTDPKSIELLQRYKNIETKLFIADRNRGFHTKAFVFEYNDNYKVIIGSSNITATAFKSNVEWNIQTYSKKDSLLMKNLENEFDFIWSDSEPITKELLTGYKELYKMKKEVNHKFDGYFEVNKEVTPNLMQSKALDGLSALRSRGENKALVVAATGTGKTYMAAFDVRNYLPKRMCFIVHREKILDDAIKTFRTIMPELKIGKLTGTQKDYDSDFLFASISTLSKENHLRKFRKDSFEYIVIDEAHRSASESYQKIINYFKPEFLLGMTATPERPDSYDVFEIYNYNIALELRLRDALEHHLVVPFNYYGITDLTVDLKDFKMQEIDKLAEKYSIQNRVDFVVENIAKYGYQGDVPICLAFCVNVKHAEYMARKFNELGLVSTFLCGSTSNEDRELMIERLQNDDDPLSFIFTVDIFNEGIDIPKVNLILMLRPTQSPIVFTQQLGRGLRKYRDKEFLTVLDFIGNHNKSFLIPIALNGDNRLDRDTLMNLVDSDFSEVPGCSHIRLDKLSKEQILKQLETVNFNTKKYLKEEFDNFNRLFGTKTPNLLDYLVHESAPDPLRFIKYSGSYSKFVSQVLNESSIHNELNQFEFDFIKYLSSYLPLKRRSEFFLIREILNSGSVNVEELVEKAISYGCLLEDVMYSIKYIQNTVYTEKEQMSKKKYFSIDGDNIVFLNVNDLTDDGYEVVNDVLEYGLHVIEQKLYKCDIEDGFMLYEKYSHKDAIILNNIDGFSPSAFREGIKKIGKDYYIFVNLHKDEKKVKESQMYKDELISPNHLQWETQSETVQNKGVGKELINLVDSGVKMKFFIRKYKKEEHYYIGEGVPTNPVGNKPITFQIKLEKAVPKKIYDELTKVVVIKE